MKKLLLLAAVAMLVGFESNAQISVAEPTSNTIRVGNRPGKGSFGIYVGFTADMFNDMFSKDTEFKSLPLVNIKYLWTDNWEARLGLQFYKKGETVAHEYDNEDDVTKYKSEYLFTQNRIYPGVAYHFAKNNILDVYGGAELLVGWEKKKDQVLSDDNYVNGAGSMTSFQFGGGLFIGLQAFVADLPLAIGLEYGFHGYGNYGCKYKQATEDGDWFSSDPETFKKLGNISGKDMSARTTQFGQQVRLTISYYFNR